MKQGLLILLVLICTEVFAQEVADKIIVLKKERLLELMRDGQILKTYKIALGGSPIGPKTQQGDGKTPEGQYRIDSRNAKSAFHLSLHVSYPNDADRAKARAHKVNPGGDIYIHGLGEKFAWVGKAHAARDWTLGCIAVTNDEIEEIWKLVPNGTPIEIRP